MLLTIFSCAFSCIANAFVVDGLTYNVLSEDDATVEVVKSKKGSYTGDIVIPEKVIYASKTYTVSALSLIHI